jgi:hypothetical protein
MLGRFLMSKTLDKTLFLFQFYSIFGDILDDKLNQARNNFDFIGKIFEVKKLNVVHSRQCK